MVLAWKAMRCNSHAGSNPVSSASMQYGSVTSQGAGTALKADCPKGWVSTTHTSAIWSRDNV